MGLTWGEQRGWQNPQVLTALVAALVLFVGFGLVERRAPEPLLSFALLRERPIFAGLLSALLTFVALASNMFLVPFTLRQLLGFSPPLAGLVMIAVPLAILPVAPLGGRLADQLSPRVPATLGLLLVIVAITLMAVLAQLGDRLPLAWAFVLVVYGAGAGLFQAPNNSSVLGAAPADQRGLVSGMLVTARQLGQVVGIAVAGAIWLGREPTYALHYTPHQALGLGLRDAYVGLALVGVLALVASWARGDLSTPVNSRLHTGEQEQEYVRT